MIQKDIVLRWVQELAKVLAKIMEKDTREALGIIDEAYRKQLKMDTERLNKTAKNKLLHYLVEEKDYNIPQLDFLAELLYKQGLILHKSGELGESRDKFEKALLIFERVEEKQQVFSMERQLKMEWIRKELIVEN